MAEFEVPQPIICSPFAEPAQHWLLQEGTEPQLLQGRRAAHYYYRAPGQEAGTEEGAGAGEKIDRWVSAVNADRRFGTWRFRMARSVGAVREFLDALPATTSTM